MQVPSARRSAARARLSRQCSRQLSRFAPGSPAHAQENEALLQHDQQLSIGVSKPPPKGRSGSASRTADDSLTVEVTVYLLVLLGLGSKFCRPARMALFCAGYCNGGV